MSAPKIRNGATQSRGRPVSRASRQGVNRASGCWVRRTCLGQESNQPTLCKLVKERLIVSDTRLPVEPFGETDSKVQGRAVSNRLGYVTKSASCPHLGRSLRTETCRLRTRWYLTAVLRRIPNRLRTDVPRQMVSDTDVPKTVCPCGMPGGEMALPTARSGPVS